MPTSTGGSCGIVKGPAASGYGNGQAYYEDVGVNVPGFIPIDANGGDLPFSSGALGRSPDPAPAASPACRQRPGTTKPRGERRISRAGSRAAAARG
ncbi:MAG: hypothetical protein IPM22_06795 [Betaproteobacteria bacterium]|nr:hypothetical protein [Betaproteobacteria bacterium]